MKYIFSLFAFCVLLSSSVSASQKSKMTVVTLPYLNICYNAEITVPLVGEDYIVGISDKVKCGEKPSIIMNLVSVVKDGNTDQCIYTVGKYLNVTNNFQANKQHNFALKAECPPAKK